MVSIEADLYRTMKEPTVEITGDTVTMSAEGEHEWLESDSVVKLADWT